MCGIIGITAREAFNPAALLTRLKRLEYRGYDSYGSWDGTTLVKHIGGIPDAAELQKTEEQGRTTRLGISHTRWATHGGVTEENAHPHRAGKVTIVHNGIIENHRELRAALEKKEACFRSETDSEVIAHLINTAIEEGQEIAEILPHILTTLHGTLATLVMIDGDERLYALKRDSPLVLGLDDKNKQVIVASDAYAFSDTTTKAIFFENNEYAIITPEKQEFYNVTDGSSKPIKKTPKEITRTAAQEGKGTYEHYMRKEIDEQPTKCTGLLTSLDAEQRAAFEALVTEIENASKIIFTAAGTAYHASLIGASLLHEQGVSAQALIASEFENFAVIEPGTLVVAVSQSGETMDVIEALTYAQARGATIASITNSPHSTIERMSAESLALHIMAGQEVAVASTKAFTNQVITLLAVASAFGTERKSVSLGALPGKLSAVLSLEPKIEALAKELTEVGHEHLYVIGRKLGYPVAREVALKIKEISYVHAEGMMGGELKHGTIALIEPGTPVISLVYNDDARMRGSTQEVAARGARPIIIGTTTEDLFCVPAENEAEYCLLAAVVGQLLAYHLARERGLPIDKPRNLAKSVTVL